MRVQVQKWGNSLALRIPKSLATDSSIEQGSVVELSLQKGRLIVAPVPPVEFTLDALLAKVSKRNLHGEVDAGLPVGKEAL
jgi:antitoxin MazE